MWLYLWWGWLEPRLVTYLVLEIRYGVTLPASMQSRPEATDISKSTYCQTDLALALALALALGHSSGFAAHISVAVLQSWTTEFVFYLYCSY